MSGDLTLEDQKVLQGGLEAESLLAHPAFTKLLEDVAFSCATEILETTDDDDGQKARERLYQRSQALMEIQRELHARVSRKEVVMIRLEQDQAAQDQESE